MALSSSLDTMRPRVLPSAREQKQPKPTRTEQPVAPRIDLATVSQDIPKEFRPLALLDFDHLPVSTPHELQESLQTVATTYEQVRTRYFTPDKTLKLKTMSDRNLLGDTLVKALGIWDTESVADLEPNSRDEKRYRACHRHAERVIYLRTVPRWMLPAVKGFLSEFRPTNSEIDVDYGDLGKVRQLLEPTIKLKSPTEDEADRPTVDIYEQVFELMLLIAQRTESLRLVSRAAQAEVDTTTLETHQTHIHQDFLEHAKPLLQPFYENADDPFSNHLNLLRTKLVAFAQTPVGHTLVDLNDVQGAYLEAVLGTAGSRIKNLFYSAGFETTKQTQVAGIVFAERMTFRGQKYFQQLPSEQLDTLLTSPNPGLRGIAELYKQDPDCFKRELLHPLWQQFVTAFEQVTGETKTNYFDIERRLNEDENEEFVALFTKICQDHNIDLTALQALMDSRHYHIPNPSYPKTLEFQLLNSMYLIEHGTEAEQLITLNVGVREQGVHAVDLSVVFPEFGNRSGLRILVDAYRRTTNPDIRVLIADIWNDGRNSDSNTILVSFNHFNRDLTDFILIAELHRQHQGNIPPAELSDEKMLAYYEAFTTYMKTLTPPSPWAPNAGFLLKPSFIQRGVKGAELTDTLSTLETQYPYTVGLIHKYPNQEKLQWALRRLLANEAQRAAVAPHLESIFVRFENNIPFLRILLESKFWQHYLTTTEHFAVLANLFQQPPLDKSEHLSLAVLDYDILVVGVQDNFITLLKILKTAEDSQLGAEKCRKTISSLITLMNQGNQEGPKIFPSQGLYKQFATLTHSHSTEDVFSVVRRYQNMGLIDIQSSSQMEILTEFIEQFGLSSVPEHFKLYLLLKTNQPPTEHAQALGITKSGSEGIQQLINIQRRIANSYVEFGTFDELNSQLANPLVVDLLSHATRFHDSQWKRDVSLTQIVTSYQREVARKPQLAEVPTWYEPATIKVQPWREKEGFTIVQDATTKYSEYRQELTDAVELSSDHRAAVQKLAEEFLVIINRHREQIAQSEAPQKIRDAQLAVYDTFRGEGLVTALKKCEKLSDFIAVICEFGSAKESKFAHRILLSAPLRKALIVQAIAVNSEHGQATLGRLPGADQVTVASLEELVRLLESGVLDDAVQKLELGQFSFLNSIKEKLFTLELLKAEVIRSKEVGDGLVDIQLLPSRDLRLELSGYTADACWTRQSDIVTHNPNMVALPYVMERNEVKTIIGNCLLIETRLANGEEAIIIRGIDPRENYIRQLNPGDFFERNVDQIETWIRQKPAPKEGWVKLFKKGRAQKRRVHIIAPPHDSGALSNRMPINDYFHRTYGSRSTVTLGETVNFNNYNISKNCRVVRTVEFD